MIIFRSNSCGWMGEGLHASCSLYPYPHREIPRMTTISLVFEHVGRPWRAMGVVWEGSLTTVENVSLAK